MANSWSPDGKVSESPITARKIVQWVPLIKMLSHEETKAKFLALLSRDAKKLRLSQDQARNLLRN